MFDPNLFDAKEFSQATDPALDDLEALLGQALPRDYLWGADPFCRELIAVKLTQPIDRARKN